MTYTTEVCAGGASGSSVVIIDNSMDSKEPRRLIEAQKARAAAEEAEANRRSARAAREAQCAKSSEARNNVSRAECDQVKRERDVAMGQADCSQAGFCEALRSKYAAEISKGVRFVITT